MAEDQFEKSEPPTQRRRQEARDDGNVAKSMDLTAACMLLAAVLLLNFLGLRLIEGMMTPLRLVLSGAMSGNPTRPDDLENLALFAVEVVSSTLVPLVLSIMVVGLAATIGQVGFLVTLKPVTPRLDKLSPMRGLQNLFNARAGMRLLMSLLKVALIAVVAMWAIYLDFGAIARLSELEAVQAFAMAAHLVYKLALKLALLLLLLGILDFAFQKWQHERDLRMSKQEVKEEMKRMEGDPLVKQRRSRVAKQLAEQRTAQTVPQADVIVTNPTHFAVALRYESATMHAPKVIAKGADYLAMRMRQIAAVHRIPIVERKPLAQALYHGVEVGQEIPPEHYAAVAEILAYVYRISGTQAQSA